MTELTSNPSLLAAVDGRCSSTPAPEGACITFSIITVCYNEAASIAQTLRSVLEQSWPHFEAIVIDGGSTDGTLDAIEPFRDRLTVFVSEPDHGLYDAMNKGLKRASGDFVCFMNAGDIFASDSVLETVAGAIHDRDRCYFGRARVEGPHALFHNPPQGVDPGRWVRRGIPSHQATFYPISFSRAHAYDLQIGSVADTDFTLSCFDRHGWGFLDVAVAHFRLGGLSNRFVRWKPSWRSAVERVAVVRRHGRWFAPGFKLVYIAGPIVGFVVENFLGPGVLGKLRSLKGRVRAGRGN